MEGSNPSWFNRIEVSKLVEVIEDLIKLKGLKEEDIGVITPYRQQVLKIRSALQSFGRENIKVGSVEQFQGQERLVIIISTVRSTIKHNEFDRIHYLGFLSNSRRFKVAITRARSLLVVIGNPHILCKLVWYCVDNGSYKDCFLPEREEFSAEGCTGTEKAQEVDSGYDRGNNFQSSDTPWDDVDDWNSSINGPRKETVSSCIPVSGMRRTTIFSPLIPPPGSEVILPRTVADESECSKFS